MRPSSPGASDPIARRWRSELEAETTAITHGALIGPYRLVRELGQGGMGVVYLAERADGQFEQRVALKLIKRGMDSDEILRRFLAERQVLARLSHPHIARLLDGGVTAEGQPYFAMEYVDGVPLHHYCEERSLGFEDRLRLFREVCEAVQYAHRSLVVHRDLKPSNILVTSAGETKLVDFGIAKVLYEDVADRSVTRTDQRLMTPEYAAPEQVRGEPVTTATDVYALGAILYQLLTGRPPHQFTGRSRGGAVPHHLRGGPRAAERGPCTRHRRRRRLRGDLDIIVLKALRKDPARRYPSVEALLEDLERHRTGLPVRARPDSVAYRARKFLGRHRLSGHGAGPRGPGPRRPGWAAPSGRRGRPLARPPRRARSRTSWWACSGCPSPRSPAGREITARELLERGARRIDSRPRARAGAPGGAAGCARRHSPRPGALP